MMMRGFRILLTSILLLRLAFSAVAQQSVQPDSLLFRQLDEYLLSVDRLSLDEASAETDFIISSVADSTLRNRVAYRVYRHFRESRVMGAENVAVYVYDRWFANFKVLFDDVDEFEEAQLYAMVNRPSLIGCEARHLCLRDINGKEVELPAKKKLSVIYFYSTECPKCHLYSIQLRNLLNGGRHRLNFYSIYTGDDDVRWMEYLSDELSVKKSCRTKVFHLKGGDSSFAIDYGVIQTPRLFLVDKDGRIVGRNLDSDALKTLLCIIKQ